jgi:hypothetical protein
MLFPSVEELDCCDLILFVDSINPSFIALTSLELPAVFDCAISLSCCLTVCGSCLSLVVLPILLVILLNNGC